ncbi:hypothetical protein D3C76_841570 [compost metagenome]
MQVATGQVGGVQVGPGEIGMLQIHAGQVGAGERQRGQGQVLLLALADLLAQVQRSGFVQAWLSLQQVPAEAQGRGEQRDAAFEKLLQLLALFRRQDVGGTAILQAGAQCGHHQAGITRCRFGCGSRHSPAGLGFRFTAAYLVRHGLQPGFGFLAAALLGFDERREVVQARYREVIQCGRRGQFHGRCVR